METNRQKVARLVGESCVKILSRAMAESGRCCSRDQPLCKVCQEVIAEMRSNVEEYATEAFSEETIAELADAPEAAIDEIIRGQIEPAFRESIARDLPN